MPRRPPKKWFYKVKRHLERVKGIYDPAALTGWIWHHHMKPATKRAVLRGESSYIKGRAKRRMPIEAMKAAIRSPRTPPHLKRALKKKLKMR